MAIEVASAYVSVGGDTRQLSRDITTFFKTFSPKFNMSGAFDNFETEAASASSRIGKGFEQDIGKGFDQAARRANQAFKSIDASVLNKITRGAEDAGEALKRLNRWQLDALIREANAAGRALGTEIPKGASEAERAIRSLDGQGLERLMVQARLAKAELDNIANTTFDERLNKKIDPIANKAGKITGIFTGLVTASGAAALGIGSLGGPIALLSKGIGVLGVTAAGAGVAGLGALGAGVASVKVATLGLEDTFKAAFDPKKAEEFNAALAKLGPQTQGMVLGVKGLVDEWTKSGAQAAVQEALFANLGSQVGRLSQYLQIVKTDMVIVNSGLNDGANAALNFVNSSEGVSMLGKAMTQVSFMAANVGRAVGALVPGLAAVGASAINVFSPMTNGLQGMAQALSDFLLRAQQTGQLDAFFQRMWQITKQIGQAFLELGGIVAGVFRAMSAAGGGNPLQGLIDKLAQINDFVNSMKGQNALTSFFESSQKAVGALIPPLLELASVIGTTVAPIVSQMLQIIGPALTPAIQALGEGLAQSAPQFVGLAEAAAGLLRILTPILPYLVQLAPAILLMVGAWKVYSAWVVVQTALEKTRLGVWLLQKAALLGTAVAVNALTIASRIAAAAQWAWNAAMAANPIMFIISAIAALVVGLVWFFTQTKLGQQIWTTVWNAIQTVISTAWNSVIKPVFDMLWQGIQMIGQAAVWLWQNVIVPAWNGIGAAIGWVWNNIIKPVWDIIKLEIQGLGMLFEWLWHNVLEPVWNGIGAVISWVWNNIILPVWNGIKLEVQGLAALFNWFWHNIIEPVWNGIGTAISWVIDNIIKPAWEGLKQALQKVGDFFGSTVEGIKRVWEGIKSAVAAPINFVINTVWNNGLAKAWNKVREFLPMLPEAKTLEPVKFDRGGATRGGRRGKDTIPALLGGDEHVFDRYNVDALGGQQNVYALRRMLDLGIPFSWDAVNGLSRAPRGVADAIATAPRGADMAGFLHAIGVPGYDKGGQPIPAWQLQLARGHDWAKSVNHQPYVWGGLDCSGYMSTIASVILGGPATRQWATSSFPGGQPWVPGLGPGFSVGVHDDPGGPGGGHTAGTLGATIGHSVANVESGGAHGNVMYGESAIGADNAQFVGVRPGQFHLGIGADGAFMSGGQGSGPTPEQKKNFLKQKITEIIDSLINPVKRKMAEVIPPPPPHLFAIPPGAVDLTRNAAVGAATGAVDVLGDGLATVWGTAQKVVGALGGNAVGNVLGGVGHAIGSVFRDTGGYIPNGVTLVRNETGKPEAVLNWEQLTKVRDLMKNGLSMMDAIKAVGSQKEAKGADVIGELSSHANLQQVEGYVFEKKMASVTAKSTKEFMGSAGKIVGESLFDIFSPSDKIPDPFALIDRYTIEPEEQKNNQGSKEQLLNGLTGQNQQQPQVGTQQQPQPYGAQDYSQQPNPYQDSQLGSEFQQQDYGSQMQPYSGLNSDYQQNYDIQPDQVSPLPNVGGGGSGVAGRDGYVQDTVDAAKQLGLPFGAAVIGVATELVESELRNLANSNVPESLNYPNDGVGSDGTSTGTFQQQQNGAWGGLDSTMNPFRAATSFFNVLQGFDWQSMDPGAAAQRVQASAYPGKYSGRMAEAEELVKGKFDNGGIVRPGLNILGNYTGGAEHMGILTDPQWSSLQLAADAAMYGGNGDDNSINIEQLVVRDFREWERAKKNMQIRQSMKSRGRSR